jgi:hypothetical protein
MSYLTKFVDTTPKATEKFTTMRGNVIMEARAFAGKYSDRITPSHGKKIPIASS